MSDTIKRRVVCAALRDEESKLVICGVRHFDAGMHAVIKALGNPSAWRTAEQGFVDNRGEFISREEAWMLAAIRGQVLVCVGNQKSEHEDGNDLYSENIY